MCQGAHDLYFNVVSTIIDYCALWEHKRGTNLTLYESKLSLENGFLFK